MQINEIFLSILEKPNIPRYYRELQAFYKNAQMFDEAAAIGYLLENKFEKKNENTSEYTDINERQSGNN